MTRRQFYKGKKPYLDYLLCSASNPITVGAGLTYNFPYQDTSGYDWCSCICTIVPNGTTPNYTLYHFPVGLYNILGIGTNQSVNVTTAGSRTLTPGIINSPTVQYLIRVTNVDTTGTLTINSAEVLAG